VRVHLRRFCYQLGALTIAVACVSVAFRHAVVTRLLPALRSYGPTLLLLSAGFDGANKDQVMAPKPTSASTT